MTDLELARALDGFEIILEKVTIPAFTEGQSSYWANYEKLEADGIEGVTVLTIISGRAIGDKPYLDIECYFDNKAFPTETYGLIYGDDLFERSISAHLRTVLGFPDAIGDISYTEQGMQGDDYISMEGNRIWMRALIDMSAHAQLALLASKEVQSLVINGRAVKANHALD